MGINFDVNIQKITTPLVAGSRNTLAVDAEGGVRAVFHSAEFPMLPLSHCYGFCAGVGMGLE
jgi:hypothetical protein